MLTLICEPGVRLNSVRHDLQVPHHLLYHTKYHMSCRPDQRVVSMIVSKLFTLTGVLGTRGAVAQGLRATAQLQNSKRGSQRRCTAPGEQIQGILRELFGCFYQRRGGVTYYNYIITTVLVNCLPLRHLVV